MKVLFGRVRYKYMDMILFNDMERLQAYKFQPRPKAGQENLMRRFAGCCRFFWNKALALEKSPYEEDGKHLGYHALAGMLKDWKREEETSFLAEARPRYCNRQ